ncbi:hypothetical protein K3495_g3594 [Podosphaera aphanis]|nr:hypothetical protein K3495_g3594 [Podosphaera aphanis]
MSFFLALIISALVVLTTANSVHFVNQDATKRTVIFTPHAGGTEIPSLTVLGNSAAHQAFPHAWGGNWYSVSEGAPNVPGMLGEVFFDGYSGVTYFDVSAIVNPNDHNGVKQLFPANTEKPVSGCEDFPCAQAYYNSDDLQTAATTSKDLICLLGTRSTQRQRGLASYDTV